MPSEDEQQKKKRKLDISLPTAGRPKPSPISPPPLESNLSFNLGADQPRSWERRKNRPSSERQFKDNSFASVKSDRPRRHKVDRPSSPRQDLTPLKTRLHVVNFTEQSGAPELNRPLPKTRSWKEHLLIYLVRLLIAGIGASAILGTLLAVFDPTPSLQSSSPSESGETMVNKSSEFNGIAVTDEIAPLKMRIEAIAKQNPQYQLGVFILDLDTGGYVNWQGTTPFSSASTIKSPIAVAFFQDVDRGKISLEEPLVMRQNLIVGEAGDMKNYPPGAKFSALETVTKMITISDNTATNMIIDRLGGNNALNQRFLEWGLNTTILNNSLPDIQGQNLTSAFDLVQLMTLIMRQKLISLASRDRFLDLMRQVENQDLLPRGLDPEATIAHKTGHIAAIVADAGLVDTPTGKRYVIAVIVHRPPNDQQANVVIQQISREAYLHFNQPTPNPKTTTIPLKPPELLALLFPNL